MTGKKKGGQRKADDNYDDSSEDVRAATARARGKRSRDDDKRELLLAKADATPKEESYEASRVHGKRRGEEIGRAYRSHNRGGDRGAEIDGADVDGSSVARPTSRSKIDKVDTGRAKSDESVRPCSRGGLGLGGRDCVENSSSGVDQREDVTQDAERLGMRGRIEGEREREIEGERETGKEKEKEWERVDKQRDVVGREREDGGKDTYDNLELDRNRGNEELSEKSMSRDGAEGSRDELTERGVSSSSKRRGGKQIKESRMSDGRRGSSGDWGDNEFDIYEGFGQDKNRESSRIERGKGKDRHRYMEREKARDKESSHGAWENERRRDWDEIEDRGVDRTRDTYREGSDRFRERNLPLAQDFAMSDRDERDRSIRERQHRAISDIDRHDFERVEDFTNTKGSSATKDASNGIPSLSSTNSGQGGSRVGGNSVVFQEYVGVSGDFDWEGSVPEDRSRRSDSGFLDNRERHMIEDEPPPGLEHGVAPERAGGAGGGENNVGLNVYGGRGRAKSSSSHRNRGAMGAHDSRPNFGMNQGSGLMVRGMQSGGKWGRGGRGPGKIGRGSGRDGQRMNLGAMPMGPGMPGPMFGQLGPPGPMGGLGPGIIGPGGFPMPPFGGRMGWNAGGDIGLLSGPPGPVPGSPRFIPAMGPGPPGLGPNIFFDSPGPVRGGPGGMSMGSMFGGNLPFGRRPMPGDGNLPNMRPVVRSSGPTGRGPSRGEQNDYSQHFVDTGLRPQNFIRDVDLADRFEEYPKLKELIARKDKLIAERAVPPMYMQCDLRTTELRPEVFGTKFDVILVDPPWEEYVRRAPGVGDSMEWWSHADIQNLRIEAISDTPAFIFLWVGDTEGLDQGRVCLKKWGFRRCEDICWVKTNRENPTPALRHDANTVLQHSKEHCLMGIKGTVRRSTDGHIIHANVDTDIIISEEPDYGSTSKPEELYHIIEHFAQGQRRIELFGEDHNIRAGWVTVGKGLSSSNFSSQTYAKQFSDGEGKVWQGGRGNPPLDAPHLVGTTAEIEALRPKSPPPRIQQPSQLLVANNNQAPGTNVLGKRTNFFNQTELQNGSMLPKLVSGGGVAAPDGGSVGGQRVLPSHTQNPRDMVLSDEQKSCVVQIIDGIEKVGEEQGLTPDAANIIGEDCNDWQEPLTIGT